MCVRVNLLLHHQGIKQKPRKLTFFFVIFCFACLGFGIVYPNYKKARSKRAGFFP
tara:strand:+ start:859 stop:1023 length:165 start_codon:yes stop_codon:yes gene_type:complete